ncbi:hypothetical protein FRACYDRAFT_233306 [Fragilariopsis cylindrus CCMP1102]|uniref:Uncharacterized protein n=1 Tax=Fragilariopsis cylindrus CCMP1102 TaxID=635003 RepID=A0A1E7FYB0_9STRA|nr:hypothetical protein FRACYDRAFT_233306 [Fragilariopsis cylindrus CCMP1102]|eukprot:OEU23139.1 hypothetical protein FRACYDRAFT_233306 [Fragilariopsis cylindrus CCMP1102]
MNASPLDLQIRSSRRNNAKQLRKKLCRNVCLSTRAPLHILDDLADHTTNDCPLPRYQMVIDPKQFCRTRTNGTNVWIPCEFDVYRRSPSSPRSNNGHVSCTSTLVGED